MKNFNFDATIYVNPVSLLKGEKFDIAKEAMFNIENTDYYYDKIIEFMEDNYGEDCVPLNADVYKYISVSPDKLDFDFSEAYDSRDSFKNVPILVECEFETDRFVKDFYIEEPEEEKDML